jgi:hypothetical protein
MPARRDDLIGLTLALTLVFATVGLANWLPAAKPAGAAPTPAAFADEPSCAEWTDGCVVCQRTRAGTACSMPGIACVPRERQCLRRTGT